MHVVQLVQEGNLQGPRADEAQAEPEVGPEHAEAPAAPGEPVRVLPRLLRDRAGRTTCGVACRKSHKEPSEVRDPLGLEKL